MENFQSYVPDKQQASLSFSLYAITSGRENRYGQSMLTVVEQAILGGADIVQLRNKTGSREEIIIQGKQLRQLTARYGIPFVVNDDVTIAQEVGADGVHLGQEDLQTTSIEEARKVIGADAIVGVSTHCLEQALLAEQLGASYIGAGPVFLTPTKPGKAAVTTSYIAELVSKVKIPFVAIGGITLDNAAEVLTAGAERLCAVRAITDSANPQEVCEQFQQMILQSQVERANMVQTAKKVKVVQCNGIPRQIYASTIQQLIEELQLQHKQHLVVELNGEIVLRNRWHAALIDNDASIELITFVGGG